MKVHEGCATLETQVSVADGSTSECQSDRDYSVKTRNLPIIELPRGARDWICSGESTLVITKEHISPLESLGSRLNIHDKKPRVSPFFLARRMTACACFRDAPMIVQNSLMTCKTKRFHTSKNNVIHTNDSCFTHCHGRT